MKKLSKKFKVLIFILLVAVIVITSIFATLCVKYNIADDSRELIVGGYLPIGGIKSQESLAQTDFTKLDVVYFSFALIDDISFLPVLSTQQLERLGYLQNEISRQNSSTKIVLSIGGGGANYFCEASATAERRMAFAQKCFDYVTINGFSGIDLDWEYPGVSHEGISKCKDCKEHHFLLAKNIRDLIGDSNLLTMAVGAGIDMPSKIEVKKLNAIVDYINVMNYDYNNKNHTSLSFTKFAVFNWHLAGFDKEKLILGVPFYGRSDSKYNAIGYNKIKELEHNNEGEIIIKKDESYMLVGDIKISFDTPQAIKVKAKWSNDKGYGGIFCWQLFTDMENELLNAMYSIRAF